MSIVGELGVTVVTVQQPLLLGRLFRFQVKRTPPGSPALSEFRVSTTELVPAAYSITTSIWLNIELLDGRKDIAGAKNPPVLTPSTIQANWLYGFELSKSLKITEHWPGIDNSPKLVDIKKANLFSILGL
jgi:hypothetical protein